MPTYGTSIDAFQASLPCGVISKIDLLFAISKEITRSDVDRYFQVARLVLSEKDPSLDLPEKDQWAAGLYGKTREITSALRGGICETLRRTRALISKKRQPS
jgi:hypothetical protein